MCEVDIIVLVSVCPRSSGTIDGNRYCVGFSDYDSASMTKSEHTVSFSALAGLT
jgi:hypothetical protein